jgi:NAD(P)-dependent dehydrogenase (short-subunit alcohol dehydrogenase family)
LLTKVVDLADVQQAKSFGKMVLSTFGSVDVLVNNAAAAPLAPFESLSPEEFETTLNINLRSLFYLTQTLWRHWIDSSHHSKAEAGTPSQVQAKTIINISSLAAVDPFPNFSIYGASKAWLDLMTHALAIEGADRGIRVCSVRPGAVETPLLRRLFPDFPADQCATPESIAELAWNCVAKPSEFPSGRAVTLS